MADMANRESVDLPEFTCLAMVEAWIESVSLGGTFREPLSLEEAWNNWAYVSSEAEWPLGKAGLCPLQKDREPGQHLL